MLARLFVALLIVATVVGTASAQEPAEDEASLDSLAIALATSAAEHWIAIVDSAGWPSSYAELSQLAKSAVSPEVWIRQIKTTRTPLGPVVSRELTTAQYTTSLPGAPDGEYVVLMYATNFKNKAKAVETITPMKDTDGAWRVSGYYIR